MRYKVIVSYDGSDFCGYQKQAKNERTVQEEVEKAIKLIVKEDVIVHASGRTDAGVHALGQVIHFDSELDIAANDMKNALNATLPKDIYARLVNRVSDQFHARYSAKAKEYQYLINVGEYNPLFRNYILQYTRELNINKMQEAANYLLGEHDFKSFTPQEVSNKGDTVRTIEHIDIALHNYRITISIKGNGFLKYMVRTIVGTLLEVGKENLPPEQVKAILDSKDRTNAKTTIDSCGLYLINVYY